MSLTSYVVSLSFGFSLVFSPLFPAHRLVLYSASSSWFRAYLCTSASGPRAKREKLTGKRRPCGSTGWLPVTPTLLYVDEPGHVCCFNVRAKFSFVLSCTKEDALSSWTTGIFPPPPPPSKIFALRIIWTPSFSSSNGGTSSVLPRYPKGFGERWFSFCDRIVLW